MARDNGRRGSYRGVSGSLFKNTAIDAKKENNPPAPTSSPTDSVDSPALNQKLGRAKIETLPDYAPPVAGADGYFDSVPSSLNDKYPIMAIPGTMPRRLMTPLEMLRDDPTWAQTTVASVVCGVAFVGFWLIMVDGVTDVVVYLAGVIAELVDWCKTV